MFKIASIARFGSAGGIRKLAARLSNLSERSLKASKKPDPARRLRALDFRIG
jgi:hypothetical protein